MSRVIDDSSVSSYRPVMRAPQLISISGTFPPAAGAAAARQRSLMSHHYLRVSLSLSTRPASSRLHLQRAASRHLSNCCKHGGAVDSDQYARARLAQRQDECAGRAPSTRGGSPEGGGSIRRDSRCSGFTCRRDKYWHDVSGCSARDGCPRDCARAARCRVLGRVRGSGVC